MQVKHINKILKFLFVNNNFKEILSGGASYLFWEGLTGIFGLFLTKKKVGKQNNAVKINSAKTYFSNCFLYSLSSELSLIKKV